MILSAPLTGGLQSSGDSIVVDGNFFTGNKEIAVKVKLERDKKNLAKEYEKAEELFGDFPSLFIRPFALLDGSVGEISSSSGDDCSQFCGLVMERGVGDLADYLRKKKKDGGMSLTAKLTIIETLVDIVSAAHSSDIVLMDFKLANVVRVLVGEEFKLKAIDFGSSRRKDEQITSDVSCTPKYVAPEVARTMLAKLKKNVQVGDTFASSRIDIFALGLMVYELASESMATLWESLGVRSSDEKGMLERAASLTDEEVERVVESNFGGEMFRDLRSFLLDALKVNPADRWDASQVCSFNLS